MRNISLVVLCENFSVLKSLENLNNLRGLLKVLPDHVHLHRAVTGVDHELKLVFVHQRLAIATTLHTK